MKIVSNFLQALTWINVAVHLALLILAMLALCPGSQASMKAVGWLVYLWLYFGLAALTLGVMLWEGLRPHGHAHWRQEFYRTHVLSAAAHLASCTVLVICVSTYWAHYHSEPHDFLNTDLPTLIFKMMGWMFVPMFSLMTAKHALESCSVLLVFAAGCCTWQHKKD